MKKIASFFLHIGAIVILVWFWLPILQFYYQSVPTIGSDFLQYPTFVAQLKNDFQLPMVAWKYIWYAGSPSIFDNAWLHFYLTYPLTFFLSVVNASRLYLMITMVLQGVFSYFLLYRLSKNHLTSLALTFGLVTSMNYYIGLFDGGTATFAATKMFFPLALLFIYEYFKSKNFKLLLLAGLTLGLSALGHVGSISIVMLGPSLLFLMAWQDEKTPLFSWSKIGLAGVVTTITLLISGPTLYPIFYLWLDFKKSGVAWAQFGLDTIKQPDALVGIITKGNYLILILLVVMFLIVLLRRRLKFVITESSSFIALAIYYFISFILYAIGHHPMSQAMGPGRLWWQLTLVLTCLVAIFWEKALSDKKKLSLLSLLLFVPLFLSFNLFAIKENVEKISSLDGYPANVQEEVINGDKEAIKEKIVPSWFDSDSYDYRFYEIMPAVTTWWNTIFRTPLVKAYYGFFTIKTNNWMYWLDNTILGEYVWHFNVPEPIAKNHALFLIDWYGLKYLELGSYKLPSYLDEPNIVETKAVLNSKVSEPILPIKILDSVTSPIVRATNSPAVLLVGNMVAYDNFLKLLATENLNSRFIIPIHGPEQIEDLNNYDLANFELIYLYDYKYKNEKDFRIRPAGVWKKLSDYVQGGGKLIIETGGDGIDSDSSLLKSKQQDKLPTVFPFETTTREALGETWNFTTAQNSLVDKVNFEKFSPPLYEGSPWKLSYASGIVRSWGKTVLSQNGKPILVEGTLGQGKVVWSGLNLPYHVIYYLNQDEALLFKNIIGSLVPLVREDDIKADIKRNTPEQIEVKGQNFKGILFKENIYPGWNAGRFKVYPAGPYFMYFRVPQESQANINVKIQYSGMPIGWVLFIVSLLTILGMIFLLIFGLSIFNRFGLRTDKVKSKLNNWWGKEEE